MTTLVRQKAAALKAAPLVPARYDWQAHVVTIYRETETKERDRLAADLAARVELLTGRSIDKSAIYTDQANRLAQTVVDGVMFRMRREGLKIVRQCVECGSGQFESAPIVHSADLGYQLSAWEPRHPNCHAEDRPNWLESDS
jgi:hypothetical protein